MMQYCMGTIPWEGGGSGYLPRTSFSSHCKVRFFISYVSIVRPVKLDIFEQHRVVDFLVQLATLETGSRGT